MIDQHIQAFKEEARELLQELETSLLALEENLTDTEIISRVFRAMHTIKGSSGMFGYDNIAEVTHNIETVYDLIRGNSLQATHEIISMTLGALDLISAMIENADINPVKLNEVITNFSRIAGRKSESSNAAQSEHDKENTSGRSIYLIKFVPDADILISGTNPLLLLDELKGLGEAVVYADISAVPRLEELNSEKCYTVWTVLLSTEKDVNDIKDVFIFVEDGCRLEIKKTECDFDLKLNEDAVREFFQNNPESDPAFLNAVLNSDYQELTALAVKQENKDPQKTEKSQPSESYQSLRVSSDKLDLLVNLVGELVTVQARLAQTINGFNSPELQSVSEEIERLTWELKDNALNIRMMPIGDTFTKFKRLIRDLSQGLGKEVDLHIEGAETELDKNVIERLNDPLVHIIRNSIDHGIEIPEERAKAGKPSKGKLLLSAQHSGMHVLIKISDDGAGLNKELILKKAKERGLVAADAELSEKEVYNLIFAPGFSTAKEVTSLSGRGVGMDVVKRALEQLRGSIEVMSTIGQGTVITLKLPLTLAIIEGLLVEVGGDCYIIPLNIVEECLELTKEDIRKANGKQLAKVRGELVPYISLREKFSIEGDAAAVQQIVVVADDGKKTGLLVDRVIGEHQTVLKPLGKFYKNVEGVSGATILGDGTVALILDVQKLVALAVESEKNK